MEYIRISAKTVDDAITEASIQLGTSSDNIEYEVVEKGSTGFLGFGSRPAVIMARKKEEAPEENFEEVVETPVKKAEKPAPKPAPKAPVKEPVREEVKAVKEPVRREAAPAKEPAAERPAKAPLDKEAAIKRAEDFLKGTLNAMNMQVEIRASFDEEGTLNIDLNGDEMGVLIGKRGQTLDSVQYLTSLVVNKGNGPYVRVKVDTEDYRRRRKETLENLARNIASKVRRTRKPVFLEPMNPYERRIIHSALQNDRYVCTHSEGEEPYRKVVITLKNEDREPRTGYRRDRGRYGSRDNRYRSRDRENREERFVREEKPKEDKED